ncbi:MAG TPA: glycosyltransferase [Thermoanaerobaculaceae bacterium]|nr:glycosyltransferase [Thermoanaerobaculaceae bacterium]
MALFPLVTVVIPVRDDAARLGLCLDRLAAQSWPQDAIEVIVVDDGSQDDPSAVCRGRAGVRCIRQPRAGVDAARNLALASARGDVLAFTDADCLPGPDWIREGVRCLQVNPGAGLVAGHIEMVPADPAHVTAVEWADILAGFNQRRRVDDLHFGATANVFTTRAVLDDVGPFDGALESGGDLEFGQRVWRSGHAVVYCLGAVVAHPTRRTWRGLLGRIGRTARGQHALAVRHGIGRAGFWFALGRLLRLPLRTIWRSTRDPRIDGQTTRAGVAVGLLAIHLVTWWTRLRLTAAGATILFSGESA